MDFKIQQRTTLGVETSDSTLEGEGLENDRKNVL